MSDSDSGIGQMSGEGAQVTGLPPGWDCEAPHPGWPGVLSLHLSRPVPAEADSGGLCAVVITADVRTAREAEVFRDAVLRLARGRPGS